MLLASTPALLIVQPLLLPGFLVVVLGEVAARHVRARSFVHAFVSLIVVPVVLAAIAQLWAVRCRAVSRAVTSLGRLPVPGIAVVPFVVIAALLPQLGPVADVASRTAPIYVAFVIVAPVLSWFVARLFRLRVGAARAMTFSTSTRKSLVVLPLALAVPGAISALRAVIGAARRIACRSRLP